MAHKREDNLKTNIGDYVMMRVYGRKEVYLAQVKHDHVIQCKIDLEKQEVLRTDVKKSFRQSDIRNFHGNDIVVKNYKYRKNIDINYLEQQFPELLLQLI